MIRVRISALTTLMVTAKAQATVDSAQTRYFIAHLHRLYDEKREASPTGELVP